MILTKQFQYGLVITVVLAIVYMVGAYQPAYRAGASTIMGNDYQATSTAASSMFGAQTSSGTTGLVIKTGAGTLASVVITGANTGVMNFYDATTTDVSKRTGNTATSSILIASFPTNIAAGTYTLDTEFSTALLVELYSGAFATSTITYR